VQELEAEGMTRSDAQGVVDGGMVIIDNDGEKK